ncbi:MAG: beta-methylgalactoside transporter inner membrane component [Syntrophorhabdus sp. PtaU1.Bin153]|nr:MAG: beta-methylgalactoside transporter inner membrane component [Syntrophorhabdus sp. PtaU1.Bin153]
MELWVGAFNLGLLYAFMAMGVFITFRVHDFPDITVDSSFVTGAAVTAVLIVAGINPLVALGLSFLAGACAGAITAFIHTRFNINGLLSGIIVMTGLYSVNLHIMGKSNIPLLDRPGIVSFAGKLNPGMAPEVWLGIVFLLVVALFWLLVSLFFMTDFGITMRATGNNPTMAGSTGVNVNAVKMMGIALANGFVAVSGSLVAQYQGFTDIGMGIGSIVFGLAAVIIGESIVRTRSVYGKVAGVIAGSIMFRLMVALALYAGLNPIDLKLITAVFVLVILVAPKLITGEGIGRVPLKKRIRRLIPARKFSIGLIALFCVAVIGSSMYVLVSRGLTPGKKKVTIGVVQLSDTGLLNITRDSFLDEMKRLGYEEGKTAIFYVENAHGDMATVNSIIDKFLVKKADIVVPISTGCAQAAINKIKDRPVVFATVANPFIIGAGKSDTDHMANVTGVYGAAPVDTLMELVTGIFPGPIKIGCMWDPSQQNAVYNADRLRSVISKNRNVAFVGATVTGSSEVYQAAVSLVGKGIDAIVLPPDNIVFSAFESIVKAAAARRIPIFISDVERLQDGALGACGYDYASSGMQAAKIVDRIIKGEKPAAIPFEQYKKLTIGINSKVAKDLGIEIPREVLARTTVTVGDDRIGLPGSAAKKTDSRPRRLALFVFSDSYVLKLVADGVMDELKKSGTLVRYNIRVDLKNAQNDYATAQAIIQDIVRQKYDYLITASTLALQVAANGNKQIPHIFGAVTDPYRMGVARSPADHIPNLTGVATFQPVESTIKAMRAIFPGARRIGIVWNPAEANSEACTEKARAAATQNGFQLVERTVNSTDEVRDAVAALLAKDIDLFFTSGDNTVILAFATIAALLKERKVPYFTNDPTDIQRGAFFSIGADYIEVGVETARMAEKVIAGESPKDIPIKDYAPEKIGVNQDLARLYGVKIPEHLLKKAAVKK